MTDLFTEPLSARLLIVDDQSSNVRLLDFTLRRAGFTNIMSTTNPCEVVALQAANRYDLILLDLQMPEMSGFEVMHALRENAELARVAILVISAEPKDRQTALAAGADRFVSKPFKLPDVVSEVQSLLAAVHR